MQKCSPLSYYLMCDEELLDKQLIMMCASKAYAVIDLQRVLRQFKYCRKHNKYPSEDYDILKSCLVDICGKNTVKKLEGM